jgi:hypothetical protein
MKEEAQYCEDDADIKLEMCSVTECTTSTKTTSQVQYVFSCFF